MESLPVPDGNLWFTENLGNKIGRITTGARSRSFPSRRRRRLSGITAGPDGNLWFTEADGNKIGRITTAGVITEFPVPTTTAARLGSPPARMATCGSRRSMATRSGASRRRA